MGSLERLLHQLTQMPADRSLDQLEADVWQRIGVLQVKRSEMRLAVAVQAMAVSLALFVGTVVGSMEAASLSRAPQEMSVFSSKAHLAPSTLLEARG